MTDIEAEPRRGPPISTEATKRSIYLPKVIWDACDVMASTAGKSRSRWFRDCLIGLTIEEAEHVVSLEDYYPKDLIAPEPEIEHDEDL